MDFSDYPEVEEALLRERRLPRGRGCSHMLRARNLKIFFLVRQKLEDYRGKVVANSIELDLKFQLDGSPLFSERSLEHVRGISLAIGGIKFFWGQRGYLANQLVY